MDLDQLRADRPVPGVLRLTLNRPQVLNAISLPLQRALDAALSVAATDDDVRAVVLAGAGRAFSAGYDLDELAAQTPDEGAASMPERDEMLWRYLTFPKPTVAAVDGLCVGAGTLYAACSDLRVGGPSTRISVTAAKYGGANLTWLLDSLVGAGMARDLLMTSRAVDGTEALRIGLLTRCADDVTDAALTAASQLAAQPPAAVREIKSLLLAGAGRGLRERYDHEIEIGRTTLRPRPVSETFGAFFTKGSVS